MANGQERKLAGLRELREADRGYRAAFEELTSAGGFAPSSFASLLAAIERLHHAGHQLEEPEERNPT